MWKDSRGSHCNTDSIQLADGPDLFSTVKKFFGAVQVQSRARPKSKHLACVSVLHPLLEGLTCDDPLAGAPVFHYSFVESEQASLTAGKGTGGLWSWPLWVLVQEGDAHSRGLERA